MLTDGVEELHAQGDQPTSVARGRGTVERDTVERDTVERDTVERDTAGRDTVERDTAGRDTAAGGYPASGSIDRAEAPFFVRIHSKMGVRRPLDLDLGPDTGVDVWMDADFHADLQAAGLDSVEAVMASRKGRCMRVLVERENWQLQLPSQSGGSRVVFLKKHHVRDRLRHFRALLGLTPGRTAGRVEVENIGRLGTIGIASMRVAAWGERLHPDGRSESFLMTEELEGYQPLEKFLTERFGPVETGSGPVGDRDLRRLIELVAEIARRFHGAGYNHLDFYCCHFFVKESSSGRFDVRLIDLQRVQHRVRFRRRWLVKDLAQLSYSASRRQIKCTHRMAFMRRYLGVGKLRPRHKRLIRRVLAKQRLMEWKLGVVE